VYGDKQVTLERLKENIKKILPKNARDRLVLENDEVYSFSQHDFLISFPFDRFLTPQKTSCPSAKNSVSLSYSVSHLLSNTC
jgi:hypothetical protein